MYYAIIATDRDDSLAARLQARPAHLERLHAFQAEGRLLIAGPHPAIDSATPGPAGFTGSLVVAEFADLEAAQRLGRRRPLRRRRGLCRGHRKAVHQEYSPPDATVRQADLRAQSPPIHQEPVPMKTAYPSTAVLAALLAAGRHLAQAADAPKPAATARRGRPRPSRRHPRPTCGSPQSTASPTAWTCSGIFYLERCSRPSRRTAPRRSSRPSTNSSTSLSPPSRPRRASSPIGTTCNSAWSCRR